MSENVIRDVLESYRAWSERFSGWRTRVRQIRALASGQWSQVFPEDDMELPLVANLFRDTIEDGGRLFAEQLPSERVPPAGPRDAKRAEQMEQALVAYTQSSGAFNLLELWGMDLIGAGLAAIKVWPSRKPVPLPRFRRIDPEFVLPDPLWTPEQPTERVILHYEESAARLEREYPEEVRRLLDRVAQRTGASSLRRMLEPDDAPSVLRLVECYTSSYVARLVVYTDEVGTDAELIAYVENPTGICPVQIAARPNWTREPMGQLDDARGTARLMNRYSRLLFDYFVEMAYGGKLAWNVKNPNERGPGTVYYALAPDARLEPVTPNIPSVQVYEVLDRLEEATRSAMNNPRSRQGDVELNKATAAFLQRAQGKLSSNVRSLQRAFAVAKRYANEAAFAQDELWCDVRKTITGLARGKRYQLTYRPSELIRGDRANIVTYGTSSGLDGPTHQVLWLEKRQSRSVSLESYLENDPGVEDVPAELSRLRAEALEDAVMAGLQGPDATLEDRLIAWRAFRQGKDLDQVVEQLLARRQTPQLPGLPGLPAGLEGMVEGLRPSGVPGAETPQRPPMLPPLELLRGGAGGRR